MPLGSKETRLFYAGSSFAGCVTDVPAHRSYLPWITTTISRHSLGVLLTGLTLSASRSSSLSNRFVSALIVGSCCGAASIILVRHPVSASSQNATLT